MHTSGEARARDVPPLPHLRVSDVNVDLPRSRRCRQRWEKREAILADTNAAVDWLNEPYGSRVGRPPRVISRSEFDVLPFCRRSALRRVF